MNRPAEHCDEIRSRLSSVLAEVREQTHLAANYPSDELPFHDQMNQIAEWIEVGECGLALESMIANLVQVPFALSGAAAVKLLGAALLMEYKFDDLRDAFGAR